MARKSLIQREKKRKKFEQKYHLFRRSSKKEIRKVPSLSEKWKIHGKQHCFLTGRPRANYQDFCLSRHILRKMVQACLLPGATS